MPVLSVERLPLPSLETYAIISVSLFAWSLYYAAENTLNLEWKTQFAETEALPGTFQHLLSQHWLTSRAGDIIVFTIHNPLCVWTVVNMAYCFLVLLGNWLQKQVFGELRVSELQHIKDKFWNFVFYKFIFIFGIINVQSMEGVILWCSWFSVIGFLHIHAQLCQDRFEYLSMTPCTSQQQHLRLLSLLGSILFASGMLFFICFTIAQRGDWITFALLIPECILITLRTTHVIAKYLLYLQSLKRCPSQLSQGWSTTSYFVEITVEISCLFLDLAHHVHMLLRANMLLSMASLVIFMQLRVLYAQLMGRLRRHSNYMRILNLVKSICPLEQLPLTFHWLEQDPSCPTCRRQLIKNSSDNNSQTRQGENSGGWMSWSWTGWSQLLQQSVNLPTVENLQLESLAEQVHQLFPNYAITALIDDLRRTRSVDMTVENILVGRLSPTPPMFHQEPSLTLSTAETFDQVLTAEPVKFVQDPKERQQILKCRKHDLMAEARNRYLLKQKENPNPS